LTSNVQGKRIIRYTFEKAGGFSLSYFSTTLMNEFQDQHTASMSEFLLQKPVAFLLITHSDSSNFECKWCNNLNVGANKSVCKKAKFTHTPFVLWILM
jgi:hypothetical protein